VPWIRGLVAGTVMWRLGVNPLPSHVGLAVDKLTLKQGFLRTLESYSTKIFKQNSI